MLYIVIKIVLYLCIPNGSPFVLLLEKKIQKKKKRGEKKEDNGPFLVTSETNWVALPLNLEQGRSTGRPFCQRA